MATHDRPPCEIDEEEGSTMGIHIADLHISTKSKVTGDAKKAAIDMRWLYYAIIHYKLGEVDDGSPIPSTTRAAVYMLDLVVPPVEEQRAMAHILGALDDRIDLKRDARFFPHRLRLGELGRRRPAGRSWIRLVGSESNRLQGELAARLAALSGLLVGIADEWVQWIVPGRVGAIRDVFLNGGAIAAGLRAFELTGSTIAARSSGAGPSTTSTRLAIGPTSSRGSRSPSTISTR